VWCYGHHPDKACLDHHHGYGNVCSSPADQKYLRARLRGYFVFVQATYGEASRGDSVNAGSEVKGRNQSENREEDRRTHQTKPNRTREAQLLRITLHLRVSEEESL